MSSVSVNLQNRVLDLSDKGLRKLPNEKYSDIQELILRYNQFTQFPNLNLPNLSQNQDFRNEIMKILEKNFSETTSLQCENAKGLFHHIENVWGIFHHKYSSQELIKLGII